MFLPVATESATDLVVKTCKVMRGVSQTREMLSTGFVEKSQPVVDFLGVRQMFR